MQMSLTVRTLAFLSALALFPIIACVSNSNRPLATRGMPQEDRHGFITRDGQETPVEIRDAFVEGYIVRGMAREHVLHLYGSPDRTSEGGFGWEYLDGKGKLITGIVFSEDKVDSIYGDFTGGMGSGPR
jgi:hypothetical protein